MRVRVEEAACGGPRGARVSSERHSGRLDKRNLRVLFRWEGDLATLVTIGTLDELY